MYARLRIILYILAWLSYTFLESDRLEVWLIIQKWTISYLTYITNGFWRFLHFWPYDYFMKNNNKIVLKITWTKLIWYKFIVKKTFLLKVIVKKKRKETLRYCLMNRWKDMLVIKCIENHESKIIVDVCHLLSTSACGDWQSVIKYYVRFNILSIFYSIFYIVQEKRYILMIGTTIRSEVLLESNKSAVKICR